MFTNGKSVIIYQIVVIIYGDVNRELNYGRASDNVF